MSSEHELSFSTSPGTYKLLELPLDLCKLIEAAIKRHDPLRLSVRGQEGEDAVLCTDDKTYSLRSVVLSNSILIVTSQPSEDGGIAIHDQVKEILELTLVVPKLHKLSSLLKGMHYSGDEDDDTESDIQRLPITYEEARSVIQASDAELNRSLQTRRILTVDGALRPIAPEYLHSMLELILNLLVSLHSSRESASVERLSSALSDEHDIPRSVSTQVMEWFGEVKNGRWIIAMKDIVKELGLGILRRYKHEPIDKQELLAAWKSLVGDTFESMVSLELLSGNYLTVSSVLDESEAVKYFPSSALPAEPAPRFTDLFLTRSRWKSEDIVPFLSDIAINSKERDKLLLKYARATTDANGVWYTPRTQYNG